MNVCWLSRPGCSLPDSPCKLLHLVGTGVRQEFSLEHAEIEVCKGTSVSFHEKPEGSLSSALGHRRRSFQKKYKRSAGQVLENRKEMKNDAPIMVNSVEFLKNQKQDCYMIQKFHFCVYTQRKCSILNAQDRRTT